ncbi:hypothetical protein [Chitinophaga niastensis]|uniref:hypothetical protein n=1 Tax=Chitinophaga niastensis TaxID=536980 RepID=UPI001304ED4C|nr:hypothetical protein [Chitinophaga niastensis]
MLRSLGLKQGRLLILDQDSSIADRLAKVRRSLHICYLVQFVLFLLIFFCGVFKFS